MDFEELYKANKILQKHEPNRFPLENNYVKAMQEYAIWYHKKLSQHDVISSLPSECLNGRENPDYCKERGKCKKCL